MVGDSFAAMRATPREVEDSFSPMLAERSVGGFTEYDKFIKKSANVGKTYYFCILKELRRIDIAR